MGARSDAARDVSGFGDFPGTVHFAVAFLFPGFLVHYKGVQRFAVIGPLDLLVIADDGGPFAFAFVRAFSLQRRPICCAYAQQIGRR